MAEIKIGSTIVFMSNKENEYGTRPETISENSLYKVEKLYVIKGESHVGIKNDNGVLIKVRTSRFKLHERKSNNARTNRRNAI